MGDKAPRRFKWFYEEEGEFEILTLASWFSHYSYSRMSIRSSMGRWLGKYSMLSKVLRSKKKEKKERKRKIEKWKKGEKKRKMKEKKRRIKCSLALFGFINFRSYFEELFHTQIFQPCCVSGSSICHLHMSTYLNVCVSSSPSPTLFSMAFFTSLGNPIRSLS